MRNVEKKFGLRSNSITKSHLKWRKMPLNLIEMCKNIWK